MSDARAEHARLVMQALKAIGVEYVVAPYEADAQMAHMALSGQVQGVITEDSDLLAYGCPKVSWPDHLHWLSSLIPPAPVLPRHLCN